MYALCSTRALLHTLCPPCTRTVTTSAAKSPTFAPPARRKTARLRSPIWKSPLRTGKVPVYDLALKYIRADSRALKREIEELKAAHLASSAAAAGLPRDAAAAEEYRKKLHILEVQSEINLPDVRYAFRTGKYPFQRPVYRHLCEQKWRKDGVLDLLMERLYQMNVVPDLLPSFHPTIDLRIQFPVPEQRTARQRARENTGFSSVRPGSFVRPEQTRGPPRMAVTAFHTDTRLYTMLLLDPDVPDESTSSFQTYLHWMQPNIAISGARRVTKLEPVAHLPYVPPHPQRGTPYHRYVLLLLPHPSPTEQLAIPIPSDAERLGFDLRAFMAQWGLDQVQGGGGHMWREVWDEQVSALYRDTLKVPEPRYGRLPKPDPYAELKERRRYVL